jgi:hypothetical protein
MIPFATAHPKPGTTVQVWNETGETKIITVASTVHAAELALEYEFWRIEVESLKRQAEQNFAAFAAFDACDDCLDRIAQMKINHATTTGALFLRAKVFKRHVSSRFYKAVRRYQIRMMGTTLPPNGASSTLPSWRWSGSFGLRRSDDE